MPLLRKAFVMQLHPGQIDEFRRRHDPIWPQLQAVLEDQGVHNYSIHLHPDTLQLFAYAEIESEERWAVIEKTDVCRDWWASMRGMVEVSPEDSPSCVQLEELFYLP